MVVAVVLEGVVGGLGLGWVVGSAVVAGGLAGEGRVGGDDGCALDEVQLDVALEADGEAEVVAGGEVDGSSSGCGRGFDGFVDGGGVEGFSVAGGSEGADVEEDGRGGALCGFGSGEGVRVL